MNKIKTCLLVMGLVGAGACIADPAELIDQAEAARLKAAEVGFEWSTTSILISEAKQAVKDGNTELAEKLASDAISQAENSLRQAEFAAANWQDSEPN